VTPRGLTILGCDPGYLRGVTLSINEERALERDHYNAILVEAGRLYGDDAHVRTGSRLPLLQNLRAGVDGVALEDRSGQADLIPSQVGEDVLGDVGDALPGNQGDRES